MRAHRRLSHVTTASAGNAQTTSLIPDPEGNLSRGNARRQLGIPSKTPPWHLMGRCEPSAQTLSETEGDNCDKRR